MDANDRAILSEIRDLQREHLAEYKRVTERSLALQEQGVARQHQIGVLYRRVLVVAAVLVLAGVGLIVYVFSAFPNR